MDRSTTSYLVKISDERRMVTIPSNSLAVEIYMMCIIE